MAVDLRFPAMGTQAHVIVFGGSPLLGQELRNRVEELDQRWSRFRADSELSQLNDHAGTPFEVSPETLLLIGRGIDGWHLSGGAFDPTILGALVRAGYDRSYEALADGSPRPTSLLELGCEGIRLGESTVLVPPNTGFDSGGIGKGVAADVVAEEAMEAGADGVCVNLGGDVRLAGAGPRGDGWLVAVQHPLQDEPLGVLVLGEGAVATSTTLKRRWRSDGLDRHHLIDPRSGLPSDSDISFVSVVADQGWRAEVLAKAILLNGGPNAFDILGGTGAEALVVYTTGRVRSTDGFGELLAAAPPAELIHTSPASSSTPASPRGSTVS